MPLYEYECSDCSKQFEILVRSPREAGTPACPACGSRRTRRIPSTFALGRPSRPAQSCTSCCPGGTCGL
ncbi:MAG: zinc ribbon domain-containing protein [Armatimonadota bacterium]